jgi:hypothetical protein
VDLCEYNSPTDYFPVKTNGVTSMARDSSPRSSSREVFLTILLCAVIGAPFVFLLALLTYGLILYIIPLAILGGALAGLHYLAWGRNLGRQTAGEREELEMHEQIPEEDWRYDERASERRF